jgi:Uma2 family endonuclease
MGAVTLLTDEEFLNMPETPGKQELLDRELVSSPVAKRTHTYICMGLYELLRTVLDPMRVMVTAGYRMRVGRWLVPDVSVNWPNQPAGDWFEGAPMIAIEVVSRGNTAEEINRKTELYLQEGAAELWIVYPSSRSMNVFRKDGSYLRVTGVYDCELLGLQVDLPKILPAA